MRDVPPGLGRVDDPSEGAGLVRRAGSGVPTLPWSVRRHAKYVADYDGHAFVTMDPKGVARSVCDGFIDDMEWITSLHNAVIAKGWRGWLVRRLLHVTIDEGAA